MPIAKCAGFGKKEAERGSGRFSRETRSLLWPKRSPKILQACRGGTLRPEDIVARSHARIRAHDGPAIFITLHKGSFLPKRAPCSSPARCPCRSKAFWSPSRTTSTSKACRRRRPVRRFCIGRTRSCVARLRDASALIIGKTNLDQFVTGPKPSPAPAIFPGAAGVPS